MLALTQRLYHEISESDFDALISKEFHKPAFVCCGAYEWPNDGSHTCSVGDLSASDRTEVEEYMQRTGHDCNAPYWGTLLAYLAAHDIVPKGYYLLETY